MKKIYGKKKKYALGSAMLLLVLLLTACANLGKEKEELPESIESVAEQESMVIQSITVQETKESESAEVKSQSTVEDTTSISGHVESAGNESFVISQISTGKASDGSDVAIKSKEDIVLITVNFTGTTEFVICSSSDGGKTSVETAATSQDLASGKHIRIVGYWDKNDFAAQKVTIYNFN